MKTYVGIDYHKHYSYGVIMGEDRQVLRQGKVANDARAVAQFLDRYAGLSCAAVLEATRNWTVMHDWLEAHCGQVLLAHPMKLRAIAEARIKTDKIDATTLAELLRCDLIPRAHVSSPAARLIKRLLRHHIFLVRLRTMVKNRIHDLLDAHPLVRAQWPAAEVFSAAGIEWMRGLELAEPDGLILSSELTLLEHLGERIAEADRALAHVGRADARAAAAHDSGHRPVVCDGAGLRDRRHRPFRLAGQAARLRGAHPQHARQRRAALSRPDHQDEQQVPALGYDRGGLAGDPYRRRTARALRVGGAPQGGQHGQGGYGAAAAHDRLSPLEGRAGLPACFEDETRFGRLRLRLTDPTRLVGPSSRRD
jgi:hypothetical protein